jgi:hypothetical protein
LVWGFQRGVEKTHLAFQSPPCFRTSFCLFVFFLSYFLIPCFFFLVWISGPSCAGLDFTPLLSSPLLLSSLLFFANPISSSSFEILQLLKREREREQENYVQLNFASTTSALNKKKKKKKKKKTWL